MDKGKKNGKSVMRKEKKVYTRTLFGVFVQMISGFVCIFWRGGGTGVKANIASAHLASQEGQGWMITGNVFNFYLLLPVAFIY